MSHSFTGTHQLGECNPARLSDSFFESAIRFFQNQPPVEDLGEIWGGIHAQVYGGYLSALNGKDPAALRAVLEMMYDTLLLFGVDHNSSAQDYLGIWDSKAIGCGIAMGVLPEINPAQFSPVSVTRAELIRQMEHEARIPIGVVDGPKGLFGIRLNGSIFVPKMMESVCTVCSFRRYFNQPVASIIELGAGLGWVGFAAWRMNPNLRYYAVDLPCMAVMQAYFLASMCGEDAVSFSGGSSPFNICGMSWPDVVPKVVLNQDSLPEMTQSHRGAHLDRIAERVEKGSVFVSINHESSAANQKRVYESVSGREPFRLRFRAPFRPRPGYMLEIFDNGKTLST